MKSQSIRAAAVTWALIAGVASCADPFGRVSADPVPAAVKLDQLLTALSARFTNIDRSGRFDAVRRRLIGSALTPAKLFTDASMWTSDGSSAARELMARGSLVGGRYRFELAPAAALPTTPGDARYSYALTRLRADEFRWEVAIDHAIGGMTSADVASMFGAMLAAPDGRTGPDVRGAGRRLFPATAAALGRAIVIDSLDVRPGAQQTTLVYLRLALVIDRLRTTYPAFASYLAKYSANSHSRIVLHDAAGRTYFEVAGGQDRWTVRYRLSNGGLVSALGAPRPIPDSLLMTADVTLRTKLFTIGFRNLRTHFVIDSSARGRGWTIVGRHEPEWVLPILTETLIGGSLRRPFQGEGAMYHVGVGDSARTSTMLARHGRLAVQESAMMRLINGIIARMFSDLNPDVEREEGSFLREALDAFGRDAQRFGLQRKGNATGP